MAARPTSDFAQLVDDAEKAVVDGAYVAVGLGVLGFQRAQVRRHELAQRLEGSDWARRIDQIDLTQVTTNGRQFVDTLGGQLRDVARQLDEQVAPTRRQLDEQIDALEERLPAGARDVVTTIRAGFEMPEARLRSAIGLD